MNIKNLQKFLFIFMLISTLLLTACGGGGGGGNGGDGDGDKINSKKIVGKWTAIQENIIMESLEFYDNGTVKASCPEYEFDYAYTGRDIIMDGKWHIADEIIYLDFNQEHFTNIGTLEDNGNLKITITHNGPGDGFEGTIKFKKVNGAEEPDETILGVWYHNLEDGKPVKGSKIPTITFKSDGSCTIVDYDGMYYDSQKGYWECSGNSETITGKWSLIGSTLKVTVDGYTTRFEVSSDSLTISDLNDDGSIWTSVYKKTKYADSNSSDVSGSPTGNTSSESILGTWYHNLEDGKPVKGSKIPTITFKSDGSCTIVDYDGMHYDSQKGYWECSGNSETIIGKWSLSGSTLKVTVDGYTTSIKVSSDSLTISGNYEDGSGTWTSVYKKTKYAN